MGVINASPTINLHLQNDVTKRTDGDVWTGLEGFFVLKEGLMICKCAPVNGHKLKKSLVEKLRVN